MITVVSNVSFMIQFHVVKTTVLVHTPIHKDEPDVEKRLQEAYNAYLQTNPEPSYTLDGKVVIMAHNAPQNLLRS